MGFFDGERPRLFGHRGAAAVVPENTMASFARALRDGAAYLEFDVHGSADGHVVVIHDPTLERTTNGAGLVQEHDLAALQALDAGYHFTSADGSFGARGQGIRIPQLAEVLESFPDVPVTIEIKQLEPSIVAPVVQMVGSMGAQDRVILATARDDIMMSIRGACRDHGIATSLSAGEVAEFIDRVAKGSTEDYRPAGAALQVPTDWEGISIVNPETIDATHRLGLEIHVWTVNDAAEMERLLDMGVDGIMSDCPAVGRRVIDARCR